MKKVIRLTESELRNIIKNSVNRILREDILGNDWRENDNVLNNYEPFEGEEHSNPFDGMVNDHDFGITGEPLDKTHNDINQDDIEDWAQDRIDLEANYDDFPPMG
jgi:hypothetical protein